MFMLYSCYVYHGYIIEWIYHSQGLMLFFFAGVLCSTLEIGPWTNHLFFIFAKIIDVKGV